MDILSFFDSQSRCEGSDAGSASQNEEASQHNQDNADVDEFLHVPTTQTQDDANSVRSLEDHNIIVGFPPGTLMEIIHSNQEQQQEEDALSSCGGTILSSAASGGVIDMNMPAYPNSNDVYALSPHPQFAAGSALSISTTETMYGDDLGAMGDTVVIEDLPSEVNSDATSVESTQLLSVPTTLESSLADDWTIDTSDTISNDIISAASSNNSRAAQHDRSSYLNVGNRLATVPEGQRCSWYSNYNEQDWERFRQTSDVVLEALEPDYSSKLVLPPEAPPGALTLGASYKASELLPEALVCPLCNDAIVGATTLSCGCPSSTVCGSCWEENATKHDSEPPCPSCKGLVNQSVPCHALDVAILAQIQSSELGTSAMKELQQAYYHRLNHWRYVLEKRLEQMSKEKEARRERLLAQYIQREEELLWKKPRQKVCFPNMKKWAFLSEIAMILLAASLGLRYRPRN